MSRLDSFSGQRTRTVLSTDSPSGTLALGEAIGSLVPAGTVISLEGGLGAGKTLLAKGICSGLGVDDEVLSPSFILVEEYAGDLPVLHFDLYRLEKLGDVERLGLYEAIDGRNVVIVEWGDRLPREAFDCDIRISMKVTGSEGRKIAVEAPGPFIDALSREVGQ